MERDLKKITIGRTSKEKNHVVVQKISRRCNHGDSAIAVAEYILSEIQTNTRSKEAEEISGFLSENRALEEYEDTSYNYRYLNDMTQIQANNSIIALHKFAYIIGNRKPWDHKPIISDVKFKNRGVIRPVRLDATGNTSFSHYFKYKDHDYFFDVWSNIHFGYIGRSIGFSESDLMLGSNAQQFIQDAQNFKFNQGDTPSDIITIQIGFDLYNQFGKYGEGLTGQHILDALDNSTDLDNLLNDGSKQTHWCWHPDNPKPRKKREEDV